MVKALVLSLLACGVISTVAGLLGLLYPSISVILLLPLVLLGRIFFFRIRQYRFLAPSEKWLCLLLAGVWLLHGLNVLTPETGFDAVWYHLPITEAFVQQHNLLPVPDLYQSLNPLFSDLIFLLGYQVGGPTGAKLIAYLFGLTLLIVTYELTRFFLPRKWSLLTILLISTFQVVTWQASSFYVDVAKAVWEVSSLWLLFTTKDTLLSALAFGASLATKLFSLLLLIPMALVVGILKSRSKAKKIALFMIVSLCMALPFYVRTAVYSGNPFLAAQLHVAKLDEIGGVSRPEIYFWNRTLTLPSSLMTLTFNTSDYVSFSLILLLPFVLLQAKELKSNSKLMSLAIFSASQWLVWWYVPPLSTRYALSGFIALTILSIYFVRKWCQRFPSYTLPLTLVLFMAISFNLAPRLVVAVRTLRYLANSQTTRQYIDQFKDGSNNTQLDSWYTREH